MIGCVRAVAVFATFSLSALGALGQEWPTRPIKFVWPYAPGAPNGVAAKTVMEEVGKILGQPVFTEFKAGAGGRFPVLEAKAAKRDDYLVAAVQDVIVTALPALSPNFKMEIMKDYRPVGVTHEVVMALTGSTKVPFKDFQGLVAYAKANPEKLSFGSSGVGGATHLYSERIWAAAGIKLLHVPYKGTALALTDRISGAVDLYLTDQSNKPHVDAGQMIVVATTGAHRSAMFPTAKTLRESGLDMVLVPWGGLVMPPETPDAVVQKLNRALNTVLARPEIAKMYTDIGYTAMGSTPEEMERKIKAETAEYIPIIKRLGLTLD